MQEALSIETLDGSLWNRLVFLSQGMMQFLETLVDETVISLQPVSDLESLPKTLGLHPNLGIQVIRTSPAEHHTCAKAWRPSARQAGHQSADDCPGCRYAALLASRRLTANR